MLVLFAGEGSAETLKVAAGGNLQAALDKSVPGDVVELAAGARFVGEFRFPAKAGTVTLTSGGVLPARRIAPSDSAQLATIASGAASMSLNLADAKNWTIDGIRLEANAGGYGEIISIERGENIVLRRLLLDIPSPQEQKRFILGNGRNITLTQSYCSGVWRSGQDSQCFVAWDGAGPYTITDNFLEAASENVMFGGADSSSEANIPSDILVENNLFSKRLEWKGQARGVKNLFELKSARRVTVRSNVFEHNWIDAQAGRAIVLTPRNQDGKAPWSIVADVLFERNIVRDTLGCVSILGYDDSVVDGVPRPSQQTTNVVFRDNTLTCDGTGVLIMGEAGRVEFYRDALTVPAGAAYLSLASTEGNIATPTGARPAQFAARSLVWAENVTPNGYIHSPTALGEAALKAYTQQYFLTLTDTPEPTDPPDPILSDAQRVEAAIAELTPLLKTATGKALTNLKNVLTRLQTLKGQVK